MTTEKLRVLVVDDSVVQRQTLADLLREMDDVEVVGRAVDGAEALRMAALLEPGLITLDLEMPKMDGFTFLRILMSTRPRPVIVVSSQSQVENVFRALELGAFDFLPRPTGLAADIDSVRSALREKVQAVRAAVRTVLPVQIPLISKTALSPDVTPAKPVAIASLKSALFERAPKRFVLVASSTGGPQAIVEMVCRLPANTQITMVIAQHMPERFTKTFADRLARRANVRVAEAETGSVCAAGTVWICPGGKITEMDFDGVGGIPRLRVGPVDATDRYSPSADRLFKSAVPVAQRTTGVVLTGMGDDGTKGAIALLDQGAEVWVESSETAVVDGMPGSVRRVGAATGVLPLPSLISRVVAL